ncbi:hypothetical protein KC963_05250, partial [Candidatus Saccharibacteria bacterium]|nr:hypothetical protein [Candidatus Saccharibacteria bacterium]
EAPERKDDKSDKKLEAKKGGIKSILMRYNIYLLMFIFILVVAGGILAVAYFQSKKATTATTLKTQDLTQAALEQIAGSDATIGNSQQVLTVQSSAVFAGKVLIKGGLEVAGNLQIGGTIALNDITVSGTSQFGQVQISKNLAVTGDTGIQGALTLAKSLQVNGGATFGGPISAPQITTSNLQLNSDLVLTKHIVSGGPTPSRSPGPALGGGGSASVSGSDTAGTVSINTGGGGNTGCFVTISFRSRYNSTPRVLLTPVGSAGGSIAYYTNRSSSSFSICTASPDPGGASFSFDYFVIN